jgi:putative ABC transport system permease protein
MVVAFDPATDFVVRPWLGEKGARALGKGEAFVGSESALNITLGLTQVDGILFGNVFRMVGVLEKTGTGLDTAIFIDEDGLAGILRTGKANLRPGTISVIFARVAKGFDPVRVAGAIEDSIVEADAVARRDVGQGLTRALGDISRMFLVTFSLAALLAALLAWAVFSGIANERSREVGLMRAMGARESHVMKLFALEVLIIGALGSAFGILAGTALSLGLARGFAILRNVSTDLGAIERIGVGAAGLAVGIAVCLVGAVAPIRRTGRIEPLVVLKGD